MKNAPKITLNQVPSLLAALSGLDGRLRIVKDAGGAETSVFEAFEFSIKMTWNKVKNIGLLKRKTEELEVLRNDLRKKHGAVGNGEVPPEKREAFFAEYAATLKQEEALTGGLTFSPEDLNLHDPKENPAGNRIPASVLELLSPFIA